MDATVSLFYLRLVTEYHLIGPVNHNVCHTVQFSVRKDSFKPYKLTSTCCSLDKNKYDSVLNGVFVLLIFLNKCRFNNVMILLVLSRPLNLHLEH